MNFKKILIYLSATVVIGSTIFVAKDLYNDYKLSNSKNNIVSNGSENKVDDMENEIIKEDNSNKKNSIKIKDLTIEKGFLSSVKEGATDEELIKNNELLPDSNKSIKDRILAKNVAENFIQGIDRFDSNDLKGNLDIALKYSADDLKREVETLGFSIGKSDYIKKINISKISSFEAENEYENDYILFNVYTYWSAIDKFDQLVNEGSNSYEVRLLKIDNEFKVVSYSN